MVAGGVMYYICSWWCGVVAGVLAGVLAGHVM